MKRFAVWAINYKNKLNGSLTSKTFCALLAILLIFCAITYTLFSLFLPFVNQKQSLSELTISSKALVQQLRQCNARESGELFARFMQDSGADLYLVDENERQINPFTLTPDDQTYQPGQEYPFRFLDSDTEYILIVHYNAARSEAIKNAIVRSLPWVAGVILALSLFGAFFFSQFATRPIIRMSKIAANMAELDFSWYCPDLREDEIGALAKSINELSDKLNGALSTLRNQNSALEDEIALEKEQDHKRVLFFSAVSHELKTPVAIVIGQLEGMLAEIGVYKDKTKYLARSAEILRSLDGFIKEIISVAHIDSSKKKIQELVNLPDVLEATIKESAALFESRSIQLKSALEPNLLILGEVSLLKKAFKNVIDNAAIYSPEGSLITIRLACHHDNVTLKITNPGTHIGEEHLPHLFEAFYRGDRHTGTGYRSGSGLGLYITRMILDSHRVSHCIENYEDGVMFTAGFKVIKTV